MITRPFRLWLVALGLGLAFDYLFWERPLGVSVAVFSLAAVVAGMAVARLEGAWPAAANLALLAPIGFFAVMSFVRRDPLSTVMSYGLTVGLAALLAAGYGQAGWAGRSLSGYLGLALRFAGSVAVCPAVNLVQGLASSERDTWRALHALKPVVRGVVLATPVVAVLAVPLSSADQVFADRLQDLVDVLTLDNLIELATRGMIVAAVTYSLVGAYAHAILRRAQPPTTPSQTGGRLSLGLTEAAVVLGSVNLLFASFVGIQVRYLFGGHESIVAAGYTYAEYARRGFGELMFVAMLSIALFVGMGSLTRRGEPWQHRLFSLLAIGLGLNVSLILASAFQRLRLYEAAYGFTQARVYAHVAMVWIGLLLAGLVIAEASRRRLSFITAMLITVVGFGTSISLLNVDAFIVHRNVARAETGAPLDGHYLESALSTDAIPALVNAYRSGDLQSKQRQELGFALRCHAARLRRAGIGRSKVGHAGDWQGFTLSVWWARRALQAYPEVLEDYRIRRAGRQRIIDSGGERFWCSG
jgi:hypothetical protein